MILSFGRGASLGGGGAICIGAGAGNSPCGAAPRFVFTDTDPYWSGCEAFLGFGKEASGYPRVCKEEVISVTSISWSYSNTPYAIILTDATLDERSPLPAAKFWLAISVD